MRWRGTDEFLMHAHQVQRERRRKARAFWRRLLAIRLPTFGDMGE